MEDMIYQETSTRKVLHSGTYEGYNFFILNLGTHPTAYIEIPERLVHFVDPNKVKCHGNINFCHTRLLLDESTEARTKGLFIGWSYDHYEDYSGYKINSNPDNFEFRKWKTEEIYEEIKEAIDQLPYPLEVLPL